MRNTVNPTGGFPTGAVIHTLMSAPMFAFPTGKLAADIVAVNHRSFREAEHKREIMAAVSFNGAANIVDTVADFAKAPYEFINIGFRDTGILQPETVGAMEAANATLNFAAAGIDIGARAVGILVARMLRWKKN